MNDWNWDVRDSVPNGNEVKHQAVYDKVNLMCYLLRDTDYNTLFNRSLMDFVKSLVSESSGAPAELLENAEKDAINSFGEQIQDVLSGDAVVASMPFRSLYDGEASQKLPGTVYELFSQLNAAVAKLCFPFLYLKENNAMLSASTIDKILNGMGDVTHFQLYTTGKSANGATPELLEAVATAKDTNLLTKKVNDLVCINGYCEFEEGSWCNGLVLGGECTVI
jgi:hypothetical protein